MTLHPPHAAHRFHAIQTGSVKRLDQDDQHSPSWHEWSQPEIDALTLAMAAGRPLLVRGQPGTGKTQLARAAAQHLGWALHAVTVNSRTEAQDLLYRFDAVKRLADAQAQRTLNEADYWEPGPLWRAYAWASAQGYGSLRAQATTAPASPAAPPPGHVILLDEIDKADSDLPNSLLELLGQRSHRFVADRPILIGGPGTAQPLVIVTSNEERELPPAFQRRCMVLNLQHAADVSYEQWLLQRGRAHFGPLADRPALLTEPVLLGAAQQLCADRQLAADAGLTLPGAAEYLDLLTAMHGLAPRDDQAQLRWIHQLSAYAFIKNADSLHSPGPSQRRAALGVEPNPAG